MVAQSKDGDTLDLQGMDPLEALRTAFGYEAFRGPQEQVVRNLIAGESMMLLLATGGGKSLCYQIPAMVRPGMGVVISPLVSLMDDQVQALRGRGIRAAALHGAMEEAEREAAADAARKGKLDLLYVSPERLDQPLLRGLARSVPLSLVAVDECHVVSSWGHEFRPSYREIPAFLRRLPADVPVVALTATADAVTVADVRRLLRLEDAPLLRTEFDRPNIRIFMHRCDDTPDMEERALDFLEGCRGSSGIVYCPTQKAAERWAGLLCERGHPAMAYHAGMPSGERALVHAQFTSRPDAIVVATIAFGMGIDKGGTRWVLHLGLPSSPEGWYQEIGRAGRDGLPATALLLWTEADAARRRALMRRSAAEAEARGTESAEHARFARQRSDVMAAMARSAGCRRRAVLSYLDCDPGHSCGNCDACLWPGDTEDATSAAHAVLSLVGSLPAPLGPHRLADILMGTPGMDAQTVAGLPGAGWLRDMHRSAVRHIIMQCAALGLLRMPPEGRGGYRLSEGGAETLADLEAGGELWLAAPPPPPPEEDAPAREPVQPRDREGDAVEDARLGPLRSAVLDVASRRGMDAIVLLPPGIQAALLAARPPPADLAALSALGVPAMLVASGGAAVLQALRRATVAGAAAPASGFLKRREDVGGS